MRPSLWSLVSPYVSGVAAKPVSWKWRYYRCCCRVQFDLIRKLESSVSRQQFFFLCLYAPRHRCFPRERVRTLASQRRGSRAVCCGGRRTTLIWMLRWRPESSASSPLPHGDARTVSTAATARTPSPTPSSSSRTKVSGPRLFVDGSELKDKDKVSGPGLFVHWSEIKDKVSGPRLFVDWSELKCRH